MVSPPTTTLTATILPPADEKSKQPRSVVVHEGDNWQDLLDEALGRKPKNEHRCSRCRGSGHNSRSPNCPDRATLREAKKLLKARREAKTR